MLHPVNSIVNNVVEPSLLLQLVSTSCNSIDGSTTLSQQVATVYIDGLKLLTMLFTGCSTTLFTPVLNNLRQPDDFYVCALDRVNMQLADTLPNNNY